MTNLNTMTRDELLQLQKDVAKALKSLETRRKKKALAAAEAAAREKGYTLNQLAGASATKIPAPAKYAHPDNPALTWTGRGRKPKWFLDALKNGLSETDLQI